MGCAQEEAKVDVKKETGGQGARWMGGAIEREMGSLGGDRTDQPSRPKVKARLASD